MSAQDAEQAGLVSKVFPVAEVVSEAVKLGEKISGFSKIAVAMAKEAINASNNLTLDQGGMCVFSFTTVEFIHLEYHVVHPTCFDVHLVLFPSSFCPSFLPSNLPPSLPLLPSFPLSLFSSVPTPSHPRLLPHFLGTRFEKRLFHATFATNDRRIGMTAFLEKKKAEFTDS